MDELISVIVPVHNANKFLTQSIASVLKQSYKNIEVILIDDGSTDGSTDICREYEKKDSRIHVIYQKNKGVAAARNAGLAMARGKYISFVDADDVVHKDFIKVLYRCINESGAPVAACRYAYFKYRLNVSDDMPSYAYQVWSQNAAIRELCVEGNIMPVLWNKLYRREIFDGLLFPNGKIHEDEYVMSRIVLKLDNLPVCDAELYYYRKHEDSITGEKNRFSAEHFKALNVYEERCKLFSGKNHEEIYFDVIKSCLFMLTFWYFRINEETKYGFFWKLVCRIKYFVDYELYGKKMPDYELEPFKPFLFSPKKYREGMEKTGSRFT